MELPPTIDRLLNLVPDAPDSVLSYVRAHPELASKQDAHGYSLLHAATSYEQLELLRILIRDCNVDPNITDEDGETCLFNAESTDIAKELINLGVDINSRNDEGQTAAEKLDDEDEQPHVAAYLKGIAEPSTSTTSSTVMENGSSTRSSADGPGALPVGESGAINPPPPLPNNVQLSIGTMHESEVGGEPDPEFRRRIEELAARDDFQGAEGQRELRDLVQDAISGVSNPGQGPSSRRRIG